LCADFIVLAFIVLVFFAFLILTVVIFMLPFGVIKNNNYRAKFGHFRSVKLYERNYGCPPEKFDPSRPDFQGHSRSSEMTRIDRLPMTAY